MAVRTGAPGFAAGVISPSDTFAGVEAKTRGRLEAATRLVLALNPAQRTATAYRGQEAVRLRSGDEIPDLSDAVPGWQVMLPDFFR